jgi:peptidoglycan hydrolase-like protein with peptidoglycan-binding domain
VVQSGHLVVTADGSGIAVRHERRVQGLQKILIGAGHLVGSANGVFGPKTEVAVKRLQAQVGLTADGIVGPRTPTQRSLV